MDKPHLKAASVGITQPVSNLIVKIAIRSNKTVEMYKNLTL